MYASLIQVSSPLLHDTHWTSALDNPTAGTAGRMQPRKLINEGQQQQSSCRCPSSRAGPACSTGACLKPVYARAGNQAKQLHEPGTHRRPENAVEVHLEAASPRPH